MNRAGFQAISDPNPGKWPSPKLHSKFSCFSKDSTVVPSRQRFSLSEMRKRLKRQECILFSVDKQPGEISSPKSPQMKSLLATCAWPITN
ncbi:uncharacterized protein VTP21DRAFT_5472 [Calcarisporiella thermophila]|uniref:uncharacterized protein n=1 Tax=Calcarisporiella thermophila TaxID=911321 RepID=UPI0037433917